MLAIAIIFLILSVTCIIIALIGISAEASFIDGVNRFFGISSEASSTQVFDFFIYAFFVLLISSIIIFIINYSRNNSNNKRNLD